MFDGYGGRRLSTSWSAIGPVSGQASSSDLPAAIADIGGERAFVVTDAGSSRPASPIGSSVLRDRRCGGRRLFDGADPTPGRRCRARQHGPWSLRLSRHRRRAGSAAGRRWTPPSHRFTPPNPSAGGLGAWLPRATGSPQACGDRRADHAGHRRRDQQFGVITDQTSGRKDYIGHPAAARRDDPRSRLTLGLPPAATAATGIDAMTHSLESLLSRNPNPFAEALALSVIRTVASCCHGIRRRIRYRGPQPVASRVAPARVGQPSGMGVGRSTPSATRSGRSVSCPTARPSRP